MVKFVSIILILLLSVSCTEFIIEFDPDKNWIMIEEGPVRLYYMDRGTEYAPSPLPEQADNILQNQQFYYNIIQDSIGKEYKDPVLIYLYNKDQAKDKIGTASGGLAQPRYLAIYYTFINDISPYTDRYGIENPFLGAHEMVHVITHHTLGHPGTKMMSEGYAVWLDGSYGRHDIEKYIKLFREKHPEYIMTPSQLLEEETDDEMVYYPNAGIFVRYLVQKYNIETINRLFTENRKNFRQSFQNVTGTEWKQMELEYYSYLHIIE